MIEKGPFEFHIGRRKISFGTVKPFNGKYTWGFYYEIGQFRMEKVRVQFSIPYHGVSDEISVREANRTGFTIRRLSELTSPHVGRFFPRPPRTRR